MLSYLGDVIVNGRPDVKGATNRSGSCRRPRRRRVATVEATAGRARGRSCRSSARSGSRSGCASERRLLITDTTLRDAHQSLLATRVRTYDMLADRRRDRDG